MGEKRERGIRAPGLEVRERESRAVNPGAGEVGGYETVRRTIVFRGAVEGDTTAELCTVLLTYPELTDGGSFGKLYAAFCDGVIKSGINAAYAAQREYGALTGIRERIAFRAPVLRASAVIHSLPEENAAKVLSILTTVELMRGARTLRRITLAHNWDPESMALLPQSRIIALSGGGAGRREKVKRVPRGGELWFRRKVPMLLIKGESREYR